MAILTIQECYAKNKVGVYDVRSQVLDDSTSRTGSKIDENQKICKISISVSTLWC